MKKEKNVCNQREKNRINYQLSSYFFSLTVILIIIINFFPLDSQNVDFFNRNKQSWKTKQKKRFFFSWIKRPEELRIILIMKWRQFSIEFLFIQKKKTNKHKMFILEKDCSKDIHPIHKMMIHLNE